MSEWREHLDELIPEHMHEAILWWIEKGEPHPSTLGGFMRAVLTNDLMGAFAQADHTNTLCMRGWTIFLYNFAPSPCHGSEEKLLKWYAMHHQQAEAVHVLNEGIALCGLAGVPKDWPEGHKWVRLTELEHATCEKCKAVAAARVEEP